MKNIELKKQNGLVTTILNVGQVVNPKRFKPIASMVAVVIMVMGLGSKVFAAGGDIELRCSSTVYKDILKTGQENKVTDSIQIKLCQQDRTSACGSKTDQINGLPLNYKFNAYLTNEPGEPAAVNIAIVNEDIQGFDEVSVASRDIKDHGFLAITLKNDTLVIGCGLRK